MSAVSASPGSVQRLADTVSSGAERLAVRSRLLAGALDDFYASRSDYGPRSSQIPDLLQREAWRIGDLSAELDSFVLALRAADATGGPGTFVSARPVAGVGQLVLETRSRLEVIRRSEPRRNPRLIGSYLNWAQQLAALQDRLRQLQRLVNPPYPGWAGAGAESWQSAQGLRDDLALGQVQARQAGQSDGPFLAAALERNLLLTPRRVEILVDLDALATMSLDEFLVARGRAGEDRPFYDWSADGCSGPIPERAQDTCLRHDFLYRNSRMIRRQWGAAESFALQIKDDADSRFGNELWETYSWWEPVLDPALAAWLVSAEVAVTTVGSVDAPWTPPDPFYGDIPGR